MSRKSATKLNTFVCPFAERCECRVKFRITATEKTIQLESQGEHSAQSHASDKLTKFLTLSQTAAVQQIVSTNPMVNTTTVRRGTQLLSDVSGRISPSKSRLVARAVTAHRTRVLEPFTQGEKVDDEEGSLTRLSEKYFCVHSRRSTMQVASICSYTNRFVLAINSRMASFSVATRRPCCCCTRHV